MRFALLSLALSTFVTMPASAQDQTPVVLETIPGPIASQQQQQDQQQQDAQQQQDPPVEQPYAEEVADPPVRGSTGFLMESLRLDAIAIPGTDQEAVVRGVAGGWHYGWGYRPRRWLVVPELRIFLGGGQALSARSQGTEVDHPDGLFLASVALGAGLQPRVGRTLFLFDVHVARTMAMLGGIDGSGTRLGAWTGGFDVGIAFEIIPHLHVGARYRRSYGAVSSHALEVSLIAGG